MVQLKHKRAGTVKSPKNRQLLLFAPIKHSYQLSHSTWFSLSLNFPIVPTSTSCLPASHSSPIPQSMATVMPFMFSYSYYYTGCIRSVCLTLTCGQRRWDWRGPPSSWSPEINSFRIPISHISMRLLFCVFVIVVSFEIRTISANK